MKTPARADILDLFVQADRSLDRARGGLGIGLTLVRTLVELHGGTISVFSSGSGKGSTFTAKFDLMRVPCDAIAHGPETPAETETRPLRILIVDDNRDSARTLARVLEYDAHIVTCVFDGLAVTDSVSAFSPDVVLLDIGLPGLDGYQVAQILRRRFSSEKLTLVAMTGYGEERDHALAKLAGLDHYLTKPIDLVALKGLLANRQTAIV
jgi:two-component system CheB/CheR fusion protein